jgi:hypothetical protein
MTRLSDHNARCVECRRPFYGAGTRSFRHRCLRCVGSHDDHVRTMPRLLAQRDYQPHSTRTTRTV